MLMVMMRFFSLLWGIRVGGGDVRKARAGVR